MQKNPIKTIESFLDANQKASQSDFTKRFLVIKGPAGTGKYTAAIFLAKKHNYNIVTELEIFDEIVREKKMYQEKMIENGTMDDDSEIQYPTNFQIFKRALEMMRSFRLLRKRTVVILRNLPEILRALVRSGMHDVWNKTAPLVNGKPTMVHICPIIVCLNIEIADTYSIINTFNGSDFTRRYVEQVSVNSCGVKKLKYVAQKANELFLDGRRFLSDSKIKMFIDQSNGDVRTLLNLINFERLNVKKRMQGGLGSRRIVDKNKEIKQKDQSKSVFQRLGRLLYVKEQDGQGTLKQLAKEQTNCHFGHSYFRT